MNTNKLIELEAVRGLAAVIVLIHHCLRSFFPTIHGVSGEITAYSFIGTPLYSAINGSAAVIVFFILSGFVLALSSIRSGSPKPAMLTALRRWPRLAFPVLITNILGAALFVLGLLYNIPARELAGSTWLSNWYYWPSRGLEEITLAVKEGALTTFLHGSSQFNSNLWTMYYEFYGSFAVLVLAATISICRNSLLPYAMLAAAFIASNLFSVYFGSFIVGAAIAYVYVKYHTFEINSSLLIVALIILAIYFMGYQDNKIQESSNWYAAIYRITFIDRTTVRIITHTLGAAIIISLALWSPLIRNLLNGKRAGFIGRISFPLYLVHGLVICSAGCWIFIQILPSSDFGARFAALAASIALSFLVAWPLANADAWWTRVLSRRIKVPDSWQRRPSLLAKADQ